MCNYCFPITSFKGLKKPIRQKGAELWLKGRKALETWSKKRFGDFGSNSESLAEELLALLVLYTQCRSSSGGANVAFYVSFDLHLGLYLFPFNISADAALSFGSCRIPFFLCHLVNNMSIGFVLKPACDGLPHHRNVDYLRWFFFFSFLIWQNWWTFCSKKTQFTVEKRVFFQVFSLKQTTQNNKSSPPKCITINKIESHFI